MEPKWTQVVTKIDATSAFCRKSGFSLPYSKTNGFSRKSGVQNLRCLDRDRAKNAGKTKFNFNVDFSVFFPDVGSILAPFWRTKPDPGISFWTLFWVSKKESKKKVPEDQNGSQRELSETGWEVLTPLKTQDSRWKMEDGRGKWKMEDGKWRMEEENGRWCVVCGVWFWVCGVVCVVCGGVWWCVETEVGARIQ